MIDTITAPAFLNADTTYTGARKGKCERVTIEEFRSERAKALAPFLRTRADVVLRSVFLSWPMPRQETYLGRIVDTPTEQKAVTGLLVEGTFVKKPLAKFKDFIEAKRSGAIVVRPLTKFKYTAREAPKLEPIDATKDRAITRNGELKNAIGVIGNSPCGLNTIELNGFDDFYFNRSSLSLKSPGVRTDLPNNVVRRYYTSERSMDFDAQQIVGQVLAKHSILSTLVTEVRSASNSGTYDVLTELAELPETVKYLYGVVKEILTLFRQTRRKVLQVSRRQRWESEADKNAQHATEVASLWMQFRYAVMPLVYSANDMLEVLSIQVSKYLSFREGSSEKTTLTIFGKEREVTTVHRCFLKRRFGASGTQLIDHLKMDVLATAWEMIPLSFVVDWALNVGDFLSSLGVPDAVTQEACTYSWKTLASLSVETPVGSTLSIDFELYEQRVINPGAHIGLNLDVFMNLKRTLDALALSWLLFKKKR